MYRFNAIPAKIPMVYGIFHSTRTNIPKIYTELKNTPNSLSNPEKEEQGWRITIPDIKLYYMATRQSGTGIRTDTQMNGTEQRAQK